MFPKKISQRNRQAVSRDSTFPHGKCGHDTVAWMPDASRKAEVWVREQVADDRPCDGEVITA
jgi:hypothetical protein